MELPPLSDPTESGVVVAIDAPSNVRFGNEGKERSKSKRSEDPRAQQQCTQM
jgi:hypothetical protein